MLIGIVVGIVIVAASGTTFRRKLRRRLPKPSSMWMLIDLLCVEVVLHNIRRQGHNRI